MNRAANNRGATGHTQVSTDAGVGFIIEGGHMKGYPVHVTANCPANTIIHGR